MELSEVLTPITHQTLLERLNAAPIPLDSANFCAPATHVLVEWQKYWLELPKCYFLRVGTENLRPIAGSLFSLQFENRLGLSRIQPFDADGHALTDPLYVEVVSQKFPSFAAHISFYHSLLDDLFARGVHLPFHVSSSTSQRVGEALRPPTPLFVYHFLRQHGHALSNAGDIIQAQPLRRLTDQPRQVPLGAVSDVDVDVLLQIVETPEELTRAPHLSIANYMNGYVPQRVWQRLSVETLDTPENRFVRYFLEIIHQEAGNLLGEPWWQSVPEQTQQQIIEIIGRIGNHLRHPMYSEIGRMTHLPFQSRVLLRREGYRQLRELWQLFQDARRPLFQALQEAIEARDVAQLYEIWAFFALVEEISAALKIDPVINLSTTVEEGLQHGAIAHFGPKYCLAYNCWRMGYSGRLHPDFMWLVDGVPEVILDAKFRLDRPPSGGDPNGTTPEAKARVDDLYKMHAYRDALGVRAAIVVYPGDRTLFYDIAAQESNDRTIEDILMGSFAGIGSICLKPQNCSSDV